MVKASELATASSLICLCLFRCLIITSNYVYLHSLRGLCVMCVYIANAYTRSIRAARSRARRSPAKQNSTFIFIIMNHTHTTHFLLAKMLHKTKSLHQQTKKKKKRTNRPSLKCECTSNDDIIKRRANHR